MRVWHVLPLPFIPWDTSSLLPFPLPRLPSYAQPQYITHQYCFCNFAKNYFNSKNTSSTNNFLKMKKICFWWNWHCDMIGSISDDGMVHVTCTLGAGWYRYQVPTCVCMWSHQAVATTPGRYSSVEFLLCQCQLWPGPVSIHHGWYQQQYNSDDIINRMWSFNRNVGDRSQWSFDEPGVKHSHL